ncbi:MAG: S-layer homology domain-containing protein [Clostridia bacterium]|nr:S-layer homology domain-containing protein [Clostridia bacterium]
MQKKLLLLALVMLIVLNVNIVFAYTDTEGHWAEKKINELSLNGIISGYADGSFKPNNNMTRAELVTVLNRLLGNKVENTRYVPDISVKDWYYVEIRKGIESGFIEGDTSGRVRPNDLITREEAICMIQRAMVPLGKYEIVPSFSDYDEVSNWAKESINAFLSNKYISGYQDNTIKPKNKITRAEVITLIGNIVDQYISYGELSKDVYGDTIIRGSKVRLNNATIHGNLIIAEGGNDTSFNNVIIEGNLVLRRDVDIPAKNFKVNGNIYNMKPKNVEDDSKYTNNEYGISFSVPKGAKIVEIKDKKTQVNYKTKNLMTVRINHNEELYFTSFAEGVFKERYRYSLPYEETTEGSIGFYKYAVYGYDKDNSYFLYIKRDNVEYIIYFYNIENYNVVDNVINSIKLFDGTEIEKHEIKTYKNPNLFLKFNYVDYVSVDDSYNTGIVNKDEGFYKMFIQVTNILDMSDYTIEQLKDILIALEDADSELVDSQFKKVYTYDAIEYTTRNDGKLTKSLYVVISTKLYHFIFTADEAKMESAGEEIFNDIISNIEF